MSGTDAGANLEGSLLHLIAESETFEDAIEVTLRLACEGGGWEYGEAWLPEDGVLVAGPTYDPDGRFTAFTAASTRVTFEPSQGLVGRTFESRTVEWLDDFGSPERFVRAEAASTADFESAVAVPIVDDTATVLAVLAFFTTRDRAVDDGFADVVADAVSTLSGLFVRAQRREAELEEKNRQLESFASVLSHDIRSPLAVATGFLELTQETGDLEYLEKVERAHERIEELIDTLLVLARKGQMVGSQTTVDLEDAAREAWAVTDTKAATLEVGDVRSVSADPVRLKQVFENLFRNSVEHGSTGSRDGARRPDDSVEHGGDDVVVRVLPLEGESGFAVEDDGPGIPPDEREEVLRPGHESAGGGFGLGLSIVAAVAEGHDWALTASESPEGGARFEFRTDPVRHG